MVSIKKFLSEYRLAIAWTGCYICVVWAILYGLFNFNMFSVSHWTRLAQVELHGFPGFVFGILILAAVPLYIATTVLTIRNKEMPVKIPVPHCFIKPPVPEPEKPKPIVSEQDTLDALPPGVPAEMREIFMRAHKSRGVRQMSVFNRPSKFADSPVVAAIERPTGQVAGPAVGTGSVVPSVPATENEMQAADSVAKPGLPVPSDFDVSDTRDFDVPVFSEINFDDGDDDDTEIPPAESVDIQEIISGAGHQTEIVGNLIVTGDFAIAVHADNDFWVADEMDWFAAGRQKPSPILELRNIANERGLKPVMYIGQNNIMDFDKVSQEWRNDGITVVTNTDDLLKLIQA